MNDQYTEAPDLPIRMTQEFFKDLIESLVEQRLNSHAALTEADDCKELYTALAKAQTEIRNAEKNTENEFLNSKYANLAAVLDVVREPLAKNGLAVVQLPVQAYNDDGTPTSNYVRLITMLTHQSGQSISTEWQMYCEKPNPQGIGSTLTYMRRYMLSAICAVAQADDDAQAAMKDPSQYDRISPKEADDILVEAQNLFGDDGDRVVDRMLAKVFSTSDVPITQVRDIPAGQADAAINLLRNQAKREAAQKQQAGQDKKPADKKPQAKASKSDADES